MPDALQFEELQNLSPEEKEYAIKVLKQLSEGNSELFNKLKYSDYEEVPVDIDTFLHDKKYLGNGLIDQEGRFTVFPYWEKTLKKIFPNNIDTNYNTLILTGGIGLGKSFMAVLCMLYLLYRMICLKDPYLHYGLQPIDKITFSLINVTIDAAKGVAWDKMQQLLQSSSWFMSHGTITGRSELIWQPSKKIELVVGSNNNVILGRALFCNFTDEVNFAAMTTDTEKIKNKQKRLISQADARMQSRFMKGTKLPTLNIIASSKNSDQSFLESYIETKQKNESKTTLIIDEPQWVIRNDKDSSSYFYVAVGNKFLESELLPLNYREEDLNYYRDKGYNLLKVPIGYYENFNDDLDIALTDIAGISTTNAMAYISGVRWAQIKDDKLKNPFTKEVIICGDDPEDLTQYKDFFDLNLVPTEYKRKPLFVHYDMSVSGDKTGLAGSWIIGKKPPEEGKPPSRELFFQPAFSVSIKAPKGRQISFEKNRQFIYWLKDQGFNIKGTSSDTFQSVDTGQALKAKGFNYDVISVDRVDSSTRICKPYQYLKSTIYEQRIRIYPTNLLTQEIIGLLRDSSGKIDHSPAGINSKDQADALCGSIFNASQHAEEYAYDYGEDSEIILEYNKDNSQQLKDQINQELQEELQGMFNPISKKIKDDQYVDFGLGKAQNLPQQYISQGIIVF